MKLYLFLAIVVCKSCNYFSHAEYDSLIELVERGVAPVEAVAQSEFEWAPYQTPWMSATKRSAKADIQTRRRSALDKNFMRFGRADPDLARFSRAPSNLMRFGRPDRNFLRFGRDSLPIVANSLLKGAVDDLSKEYATSTEQLEQADDVEAARMSSVAAASKRNTGEGAAEEMQSAGLTESGEQIKPKQILYYRRDSPKNLMRFGKRRSSGYMRFGRANLMHYGRGSDEPEPGQSMLLAQFDRSTRAGPPNLMRFGRAGNLMRFGRSDPSEAGGSSNHLPNNNSNNETSSLRADAGRPMASRETHARNDVASLPGNLLELLDGVHSISKEQESLLLDVLGADAERTPLLSDERFPLYVSEK